MFSVTSAKCPGNGEARDKLSVRVGAPAGAAAFFPLSGGPGRNIAPPPGPGRSDGVQTPLRVAGGQQTARGGSWLCQPLRKAATFSGAGAKRR